MDEENRKILKMCLTYFNENLQFTENFFDRAIAHQLLTSTQINFVKNPKLSPAKRVMALLEKLERGDNDTIHKLIKTLDDSKNDTCADLLRFHLSDHADVDKFTVEPSRAHILLLKGLPLNEDDADRENFPFLTHGDPEKLMAFFKELNYNTKEISFPTGNEAYADVEKYIRGLAECDLIGLIIIGEGNNNCLNGNNKKKFYSQELFSNMHEKIPKFVMFFTKHINCKDSADCVHRFKGMKNSFIADLIYNGKVQGDENTKRIEEETDCAPPSSYAALWLRLVRSSENLCFVHMMQEFNLILRKNYPDQPLMCPWINLSKTLRFFP